MNAFLGQTHQVLPQLLGFYDADPTSPTHGVGDRFYWAWKLIDFANGTFQGAANGLARLYRAGLLPPEVSQSCEARVDSMFQGTATILRRDGSLEEAFPYESSFCVTALVAYDLLTAIEVLGGVLNNRTRQGYLGIIKPMVSFLRHARETHGLISNHLATAAAALYKWSHLSGEPGEVEGRKLLDRVLTHQSPEGWYQEYEGADPGYQSLCICYLADLHRLRPDLGLARSLRISIEFLWHFAHPDGSFGGLYGSRNTRFYYPGGIRFLAEQIPEARALHRFMASSIERNSVVTLVAMDPPNMVPMFNAYAWTAVLDANPEGVLPRELPTVPCLRGGKWSKEFPQAGLHIRSDTGYYTVVSSAKGGVVAHFDRQRRAMEWNAGVLVKSKRGTTYSTQAWRSDAAVSADEERMTIVSTPTRLNQPQPTPLRFLVLRVLSMTLMRNRALRDLVKKGLVWLMVTRKRALCARVLRRIRWQADGRLAVEDCLVGTRRGAFSIESRPVFRAIHMASSGYWQTGDR